MSFKTSVLLLFVLLGIQANGQFTLVGNWKRAKPIEKSTKLDINQKQWGDLEIRSDSIFHIEGDKKSLESKKPGWHIGNEYNGTWSLKNGNILYLYIEPKENKLFLWYTIIKITDKKLVLKPSFAKDNKNNISFNRLL